MDKKKYKTIAIVLLILWMLSLAAVYSYFMFQYVSRHLSETPATFVDAAVAFAVSFLYLFPLLLFIKKYSRLAEMKKLNRFASMFAWVYVFAACVAPLAMCAAASSV